MNNNTVSTSTTKMYNPKIGDDVIFPGRYNPETGETAYNLKEEALIIERLERENGIIPTFKEFMLNILSIGMWVDGTCNDGTTIRISPVRASHGPNFYVHDIIITPTSGSSKLYKEVDLDLIEIIVEHYGGVDTETLERFDPAN